VLTLLRIFGIFLVYRSCRLLVVGLRKCHVVVKGPVEIQSYKLP
jgi:hypothetical protein